MSNLPPARSCETPQQIGACLAAIAEAIACEFGEAVKRSVEPLHTLSREAIEGPVRILLTCIADAGVHTEGQSVPVREAMCTAGAGHGRLRAALPDYAERFLAEEYAVLRNVVWLTWHRDNSALTAGILWLQRQLDVVSTSAFRAFEAARQPASALQSDVGLSGPLIGGYLDPFWKYDAATDVLLWSEEIVTAWGYAESAQRCDLAWWTARIHPEDRERIVDEVRSHAALGLPVGCYYYRFRHADGHFVPVADRVYRVFDATGTSQVRVGMVVATSWPLVTRDDAAQAPSEMPRPEPDAVVPLPSSLALIDTQRRFVYANQALLDYWSVPLDKVRGLHLEEVIGPANYVLFPHEAPRAFSGSFVSFEVPFRARNGEARWHLFNYLPYRDNDGVVQGVACHVSDLHLFVSDDDNHHDRYRRLSRQYQALLSDLEQYLSVPQSRALAMDASEQRIADLEAQRLARERFVTMLTHDLRNPLAAARLTAERLVRQQDAAATKQSGKRRPASAERLILHLDRADRMVTDLLDANRLQSGAQLVIDRAPIELGHAVHEAVRDFSLANERIVVDVPERPVVGNWDPQAVRRILENLLSNAVKYGDADRPITVSLKFDGEAPALRVHNWGVPLPRQGRDVLFHPFERHAQATRSGQPGWGIGLALVRALAQAHGGKVTITSALRHGTAFQVHLPTGKVS